MAQNQKIGLLAAIVVQTNAMIGAGIVAIPGILVQTTSAWGLLSYVACIFIIMCMTFSMGELSLIHGGEAWCYRFPYILGKHKVAMFSSFCYLFGVLVAMGFVAKQAGIWLHESMPFLSADALCFLSILCFTLLVLGGKNLSSFWQYVISAIIFLNIITISLICFANFKKEIFFTPHQGGVFPLITVMPMLLFSFLGFECISSLYGIIKNPRKNVLKGGVIGAIAVGVLYLLFATSILGAVPASSFTGEENQSLARVLLLTFPKFSFISTLIYLGGLFAILGTLHSMIWSLSVLSIDVVAKSKNPKITTLLERKKINQKTTLLVIFIVITLSSFTLKNEAILNLTVLLISISLVLSILALFKEQEHRLRNRLICIFGVSGALLMILFSLYALL
jgi:APA family basic amino acid/polyamine antiporter